MSPLIGVLGGVMVALVSAIATVYLGKRSKSGDVETSEAKDLWDTLRAELSRTTAENAALREEAVATRQEAMATRQEAIVAREEMVTIRSEMVTARSRMKELEAELEACHQREMARKADRMTKKRQPNE